MKVGLRVGLAVGIARDVVVDDHVDLEDVDSASDDIGGDEDLGLAIPERFHDSVAFGRFELAVQRRDLVSLGSHALGDLVGRLATLAGDNAIRGSKP